MASGEWMAVFEQLYEIGINDLLLDCNLQREDIDKLMGAFLLGNSTISDASRKPFGTEAFTEAF